MPFATKFRAMMDFPFAGDAIGRFIVESVDVGCDPHGSGRYTYPVRIVLHGPGGQQGVRTALKKLLRSRTMTFSAYGNAYQLWFAKPEVESLSDKRYSVTVEGAGARVTLADELHRFAEFLDGEEAHTAGVGGRGWHELVDSYLDGYRAEVKRKVGRYRGRLRRAGANPHDLVRP